MLTVSKQRATLAHVNLRGEKHGTDTVPATDLRVEIESPNTLLEQIEPGMLAAFYCDDPNPQQAELIARPLSKLRFPSLGPLTWDKDFPGYTARIAHGIDEASAIVLGVQVNKFSVGLQDGGTVILRCRLQCTPDDAAIGELARKIGQTIEITLEPPAALPESAAP